MSSFRLLLIAALLVLAAGTVLAAGDAGALPRAVLAQPTADPYAQVRATANQDYQQGLQQLTAGDLEDALVSLDQASVNDPDSRPDIQAALDQTVAQLRAQSSPTPSDALNTPTPFPLVASAPSQTPSRIVSASPAPGASPVSLQLGFATAAPLQGPTWSDPAGRFTINAPADWQTIPSPATTTGQGVVGFRDPTGQAEFDISEDQLSEQMAPELYSARLDIAMQQVAGYSLTSVTPGVTDDLPSVRRDFTFQQTTSGGSTQVRAFQVALTPGSVAYVLSGWAPATQYEAFSSTFDSMVAAFSLN